jgi:UPF0755 protein
MNIKSIIKNFVIVICVCVLFGALYWNWVLPCNKDGIFQIQEGQNLTQVAKNLKTNGFIQAESMFCAYVMLEEKEKDLKYGVYKFSSNDTFFSIADKIIQGDTYTIKITIPEGFNIKQIDERLAENQLIERESLINSEITTEFAERGAGLEGFLFPDTYYFFPSANIEEITQEFLNNFDSKLNSELRQEIKNQSKTIFEIITMASLLEKEVQTLEDKKIVSGILWKRIKTQMPLQVDATITYITDKKSTKVSFEDLEIDSLYNTYKYRGLPAGPICNPGLESVKAAIYPESSQYWYYISTREGETKFARTLKEHNINIAKYLR